jgi:hypothetical protein
MPPERFMCQLGELIDPPVVLGSHVRERLEGEGKVEGIGGIRHGVSWRREFGRRGPPPAFQLKCDCDLKRRRDKEYFECRLRIAD